MDSEETTVATAEVLEQGTRPDTEALTYQVALRAIGAWLDANDAGPGVRLIETDGGFLVQRSAPNGEMISDTLTFDSLWDLDALGKRKKNPKRKGPSYQNFLRAVGHELDAADAKNILVAEIGDEVLITYLYPHYVGGFALIKHFSVIKEDERDTVVQTAVQRRGPGRLTKGLSRLLGDQS